MSLPDLTIETLCAEAAKFSQAESRYNEPTLFGVTDGKAIGTYLEQKFRRFLQTQYQFIAGNSAIAPAFVRKTSPIRIGARRSFKGVCDMACHEIKKP